MLYIECKPDETLVRSLLQLSRREVVHELKGKFEIANRLRSSSGHVAMVDEDPGANQPPYLTRMQVYAEEEHLGLRGLFDGTLNHRVIVLRPRLEEWLVRTAHDAGVELVRYGLPANGSDLHKVINHDLRKLERLLGELQHVARLSGLRRLLRDAYGQ